jgi:phosphatidylglycerol---prolipoprotein diacylglyceryl transferase
VIPYIHIPTLKIFGLIPIQPFGVLVGIAIVLGYSLGRRRARLWGLDPDLCADGEVWTIVVGFVLAHLVSVIFYFPHRILENPLTLLAFWSGLSSFGGFVGGILGCFFFFKKRGVSVAKYADAITFGIVPAWIFGRMGCSIVHDHPGKATTFLLGVQFPARASFPAGVYHDLGFYELLVAVFLTIVLYSLKNVRPFDGFHPAVVLLCYSPIRFMLDYLRVDDKKYFGFTPGQFFAIGMVLFAVFLIVRGVRAKRAEQAGGEAGPPDAKRRRAPKKGHG